MTLHLKLFCRICMPVLCSVLLNGCTTPETAPPEIRPDIRPEVRFEKQPVRIGLTDFKMSQSAEEVKKTIMTMGYAAGSRRGSTVLIDHLLDPAVRHEYIGKAVSLEKYDAAGGSMYEVDLKFNEYFKLENVIIRHVISSGNDYGLLKLYLKKYPMLVFQGSEDGEDYNPVAKKREKITNSNYHFDIDTYAFLHLNHIRIHKEDGQYEDVITFNAHDSRFVVQEAYKRTYEFMDGHSSDEH